MVLIIQTTIFIIVCLMVLIIQTTIFIIFSIICNLFANLNWCSSDWLIYHLLYLHLFTSVCRGLPSKLHFMQKQCETLYWHIVPYFALFSQMKTFAVIKNNPTKWIPSARCETGIQVSVSQPELHKFHSISQAQATCSGVASQKNWGRQKFWFQASYSILFGIPPLKAQND